MSGIFIKVRLLGCDSSNDRWLTCYDPELAHFGYTKESFGHDPPPPIGYTSTSNVYARFIDKVAADGSRPRLTKEALLAVRKPKEPRPGQSGASGSNCVATLDVGAKLEAMDPKNFTGAFHPATIVGRAGDKVEVHFDGWKQHNMICKADSCFLFPIGWAAACRLELCAPLRKGWHFRKSAD